MSATPTRSTESAHSTGHRVETLGELAHASGVPYWYLRAVVERRRDPYVSLLRTKRDGSARPISAPEPLLMQAQRWILRNILCDLPQHHASFAYRESRSIADCAREHVGARWLVKMDIHDFFGSVAEQRVYRVFRDLGYKALFSLELARLCTRVARRSSSRAPGLRYRAVPSYVSGSVGVLPQGGPTSGALANAVATRMDRALFGISRRRGLTYTRYSDDLIFSAGDSWDRARSRDLISQVTAIAADNGFEIHKKKTHIVPPGARHVAVGLMVTDDAVRLLPEFRRKIEVHVRGVEQNGIAAHAAHRGFDDPSAMVNYVGGCLSFALAVEDEWAEKMRRRWLAALERL
ncbi:reverse transcriptase family protein [Actinomycetaceae bacterium L2_0104]